MQGIPTRMNTFIKPFFPPSHQSKLYGMVKKIVFSRSRWYQSDSVGIPLGLLHEPRIGAHSKHKVHLVAQGSAFFIFSSLKRASFVKNKKARFVPKWTSFVIPLGLRASLVFLFVGLIPSIKSTLLHKARPFLFFPH